MNRHLYLRAYLAGIAVPTVLLLAGMTAYTIIRYVYAFPIPIERVIVFPMAAVPNAWGLWNVLYHAFDLRRRVPLGVFGAVLPLLLIPGGYAVARLTGFTLPEVVFVIVPFFVLPVGIIAYYLLWKYFVGFLNAELGIA